MNKKIWLGILAMVLVFGISVLVIGCGKKGGTVEFTNDSWSIANVGIAVSTIGTPSQVIVQTVRPNETIRASIDEDGFYAVSGTMVSTIIGRNGQLTGGETVKIKMSDF